MSTEVTKSVARRYFDAWTSRDRDTVTELLAENLHFAFGPDTEVEGRDAFLGGASWPEGVTVTMVAEAYEGSTAMQMYDAVHGNVTLRVAERLHVTDGVITDIMFVTDTARYPHFVAGHEIPEGDRAEH